MPAILELVALLAVLCPSGAQCCHDIMNMLVLATTIFTSGGNITPARLRRIVQATSRELMTEIDITRESVLQGWNFLSANWSEQQTRREFEQVFEMLSQATQPIALRLSLMCQQTKWKMLIGIVMTIRAINGFRDFPWQNLFEYIQVLTGNGEGVCRVH